MKPVLPLALVLVSGIALAQHPDIPEKPTDSFARNDSFFRIFTSVKPHTLTSVRKNPESYRDLPVQMEIQFHELRHAKNPFFTRFSADGYLSFAAWGGEQSLWHREDYLNDHPLFFVDRGAPMRRTLLEAKIYDRIRVTAVVRDVFKGVPYLEVTKAEIVDSRLTEATIVAAARAEQAAQEGETASALSFYEQALRGKIPDESKAQLHLDIAQVHLMRADKAAALAQIEAARQIRPDDGSFSVMHEKVSQMSDADVIEVAAAAKRAAEATLAAKAQRGAPIRPALSEAAAKPEAPKEPAPKAVAPKTEAPASGAGGK